MTPEVTPISGEAVTLEVAERDAVALGADQEEEIVSVTPAVSPIFGIAVTLEVAEGDAVTLGADQEAVTPAVTLVTGTDTANKQKKRARPAKKKTKKGAGQAVGIGNQQGLGRSHGVHVWCV